MKLRMMSIFLALLTAAAGYNIHRQFISPLSTPVPPGQDPWYSAPAGFESHAPGTVFKIRNVPALAAAIPGATSAYQLLYRTSNSQYRASWAVTTLLLPPKSAIRSTEGTYKKQLLSYSIGYDSADVDASPSYALYTGGGVTGTDEITSALTRGWAVDIADYEGPLASFTAGVQSGHATLDSVRAVFACPEFGFGDSETVYALWGYSGGALASEWAAELQAQYAPELNFAGAALGGTTPNISSVLLAVNGTAYAGLGPPGILGLVSQYRNAETHIQEHLFYNRSTYNATQFNAARNYSLSQASSAYAGQDLTKYFTTGYDAIRAPIIQELIDQNGVMGYHGVPQMPLFVYKAIADDVSLIADTDVLVDRYCRVGAIIKYERNTIGDHATELYSGRARALSFLDQIFADTYSAHGCQVVNVTVKGDEI